MNKDWEVAKFKNSTIKICDVEQWLFIQQKIIFENFKLFIIVLYYTFK